MEIKIVLIMILDVGHNLIWLDSFLVISSHKVDFLSDYSAIEWTLTRKKIDLSSFFFTGWNPVSKSYLHRCQIHANTFIRGSQLVLILFNDNGRSTSQLMTCNETYQGLYKTRYVNDTLISSGFKTTVTMYSPVAFVLACKTDNKADTVM